jgi:Avidin family
MGLSGKWYNDLKSELELNVGSDGLLSGTYETKVSSDGCAIGKYSVAGRTDVPFKGETLGFAVAWHNDDSDCEATTTWVGHYRAGGDGVEESLTTFWLMAEKSEPGKEWESIKLGRDVFTR